MTLLTFQQSGTEHQHRSEPDVITPSSTGRSQLPVTIINTVFPLRQYASGIPFQRLQLAQAPGLVPFKWEL